MPLLRGAHAFGPGGRHQPGVHLIGAPVVRLESAGSTNDVAAGLAARGYPEGTLVVAGAQRCGRGRHGRAWHSPPGANLYCSVVLRPVRPLREWPDLSWILAAAVASSAREAGAQGVIVKFPNDVVAGGRKLAGLLLETRTGPGAAAALIAGIGFNVNLAAGEIPPELQASATSLALLTGRRHDCSAVLGAVCRRLEHWYQLWSAGGAGAAGRLLDAEGLKPAADGESPHGALQEDGSASTGGG